VSGLVINNELCRGCGICVRSCASGGVVMEGTGRARKARATDACVFCGSCVGACPFGAISIEKDEAPEQAPCADVWVFVQVNDGAIAPVSLELLGKGRELANARGCKLVAVVGEAADTPCACNEKRAGALATEPSGEELEAAGSVGNWRCYEQVVPYGVDQVLFCLGNRLAEPSCEAFAALLCDLARERRPEIVLFGATNFGRELAPTVAARLGTGLTADCTVLSIDEESGLLHQTRPAFGGNLMATIMCPNHRPQMATVRGGVFAMPEPAFVREVELVPVELDPAVQPRVRVLETVRDAGGDSIADAEVLVVVGRGIGSQKNLPLVRRLAELLGAKLGCSRPLVETGWLEYKHQVGQTGVSVAPKLLVSVGVSGAIQHLAGIGGAQTLVAINSDAEAPIFGVSQYSVVGDCVEVVREWVAALEAEGR